MTGIVAVATQAALIGLTGFLCLAVALVLCDLYKKRHIFKFARNFKGYKFYPVVGNAYCTIGKDVFNMIENIKVEFGIPGNLWNGHDYHYITADASEVKLVLNHPSTFEKGTFYDNIRVIFENTLLLEKYEDWKRNRKIFSRSFSQPILNGFVDVFYEKACTFVEILKKDEKMDIYYILARLSLDNFCANIMGFNLNAQTDINDRVTLIVDRLQLEGGKRAFTSYFIPHYLFFLFPSGRAVFNDINEMNNFIYNVINQKRQLFKAEHGFREDSSKLPLMDMMLETEGKTFSDEEIAREIILFLLAGLDTSGVSLAYIFTLLGMYPEFQEKVYQEINQTVGLERPITHSDIPNLKYTERVINESMRILPVVPFIERYAESDVDVAFTMSGNCERSKTEDDTPELLNFTITEVVDPKTIIEGFGYPAETHKIVTEDGYILILHRIPKVIRSSRRNPPVLIMHGIGSSSADFINMGPNISLGYALADKGYDVWIGNARGNSYSNRHVCIDPKLHPEKFYNFSWHEIGSIDLPAKIDYILKVTKQKQLYYIGHSQGGTIFYVMASTKPGYNDKIRLASLMAPAGLVNNVPEPIIQFLSQHIDNVQSVLEFLHIYHIPLLDLIRSFMQNLCKHDNYFAFCKEMFYIFGGGFSDDNQLSKDVFPRIFRTTPSDASSKQFLHYFQEVKSGKFQHFDYGPEENSRIYGTLSPLEYNLTAVTAPVALYYAKNDRFVGMKDVQLIASRLPHVVKCYLIPYEKFNHGDFLFANDVRNLMYKELLPVMDLY